MSEKQGSFLFIVAVALAMLVALSAYRPGMLASRNHYTLELEHGFGVQPSMYVTIAGLRVGTVEEVRLTADRTIELLLGVEVEYARHVRSDSRGDVVQLLAGKTVEIGAGSGEALSDGGALVGGTNFDLLLELQRLELADTLARITRVLEEVDRISRDLSLGDGAAEGVTQLLTILQGLEDGNGTLGRLLKDDSALVKSEATLQAAQDVTTDLSAMATDLSKASQDLSAASSKVASASTSTEDALEDVTAATAQMNATMKELSKTLEAMQQMPGLRRAASD